MWVVQGVRGNGGGWVGHTAQHSTKWSLEHVIYRCVTYLEAVSTHEEFVAIALIGCLWAFISPVNKDTWGQFSKDTTSYFTSCNLYKFLLQALQLVLTIAFC